MKPDGHAINAERTDWLVKLDLPTPDFTSTAVSMSATAGKVALSSSTTTLITAVGPPDILLTHSPPKGLGDGEDLPHQGFEAFHRLLTVLRPKLMVHGHLHPYGRKRSDRHLGETLIVNAVPHRLLEL